MKHFQSRLFITCLKLRISTSALHSTFFFFTFFFFNCLNFIHFYRVNLCPKKLNLHTRNQFDISFQQLTKYLGLQIYSDFKVHVCLREVCMYMYTDTHTLTYTHARLFARLCLILLFFSTVNRVTHRVPLIRFTFWLFPFFSRNHCLFSKVY